MVNRQYLSNVSPTLIARYGAEAGKELGIFAEYLAFAIDSIQLAGLILIHQCWRGWDKSSLEEADDLLVSQLHEALFEERFDFATRLSAFAESNPVVTENAARWATIYYAVALKELGRSNEMNALLSSKDWSASSLRFQLALTALRNREDQFYELLPKCIAAGDVSRQELLTWPLFREQRDTDRFREVMDVYLPRDSFDIADE